MRAELNERERRTANYLAPDANEVVVMCFIPFSLSALWLPVSYSTFFFSYKHCVHDLRYRALFLFLFVVLLCICYN